MPTRDWTREQIIDETVRQASASGADPAVILAVFEKESGFNERAVGDSGNSFGLRQLNRFGQLYGHSPEWAFDPANAIPDAVKALGAATTAQQATRVQNPARPSAYAASLQPLIDKWRRALSGGGTTAAPARPKWSPDRDAVQQLASQYRLRKTDGDRSPNAGYGAPNSDHSTAKPKRWADDYAGAHDDMLAFERAVKKQFPHLTVLGLGHAYSTGPHIHVAGDASSTGTASATPSASDGDMQRVGFGIPGVDLPDRGDVLRVLFVVLLFVLGLALFAFGVVATFKDAAIGFAVGGVAKGAKAA